MQLHWGVACSCARGAVWGCAEAQRVAALGAECGTEPGRIARLRKGRSMGLRWGTVWGYAGA